MAKVKIRKCKGFNHKRCETCKRKNPKAELLAPDGTCIYYVDDPKVINRPTKFN